MQSSSVSQAKKHIEIAIRLKRIVRECHPDWSAFLATYTANQLYQDIETGTGEEFWSIHGYCDTPSRTSHVKDPDALVVHRDEVRFLIEIKWGAVPQSNWSDVPRAQADFMSLASTLNRVAVCRVRGPAVQAGYRHSSRSFREQRDYPVCADHQTILVADFRAMHRLLPESYEEMLRAWTHAGNSPRLADIGDGTGKIPALISSL